MNLALLFGVWLPAITGVSMLAAIDPVRRSRTWRLAAGWLLGQLLLGGLMYLQAALIGRIHVIGTVVALFALGLVGAVVRTIHVRRIKLSTGTMHDAHASQNHPLTSIGSGIREGPLPPAAQTLFIAGLVVMTILTLARYAAFAAAAMDIPIRVDDAYTIWLYKAKVIVGLGTLPLDPQSPFFQAGSFTQYPPLVPLLAAWLPMCAGQWSERLVALSWILFHLSLIGVTCGAISPIAGRRSAIVVAYLVGSIPLACIHAYRPGYADLPMACFLVATVGALLRWLHSRRSSEFFLAVVFATAVAGSKREGIALAAITLGMFMLAGAPILRAYGSWRRAICAATLAAAALVTMTVVDLRDQGRALSTIEYHPEVWASLRRHTLDWLSFGPAFALIGAAVVVVIWQIACRRADVRMGATAAALSLLFIAFVCGVFLFTDEARFALNDQTPSRLFLHVLPAMILTWAAATQLGNSGAERAGNGTRLGDMAADSGGHDLKQIPK